jgi:peptidoglycan hydrolase-like protein with peptidoglycan-binding domain
MRTAIWHATLARFQPVLKEQDMHAASRILTGALLLAGSTAFAQASATASAVPATARIYAPITIAVTSYNGGTGLSFGDIIPGVAAGTLRLDPVADARTPTGVTVPATSTMAVHSAKFAVGANQASGDYTGAFNVTVTYN